MIIVLRVKVDDRHLHEVIKALRDVKIRRIRLITEHKVELPVARHDRSLEQRIERFPVRPASVRLVRHDIHVESRPYLGVPLVHRVVYQISALLVDRDLIEELSVLRLPAETVKSSPPKSYSPRLSR